jgi:hypothetical protein
MATGGREACGFVILASNENTTKGPFHGMFVSPNQEMLEVVVH